MELEENSIGIWDEPEEYEFISWQKGMDYVKMQGKEEAEEWNYDGHTEIMKTFRMMLSN